MTLTIMAALLAATAAFLYYSSRRDLKAAETRVSSGSKLIATLCGQIEYADAGTGPPVLVIHGAGGGFDQGLEVGRPLLDHGYRVIAPSRFGYLRTPMPPDASPQAQADAHACLLNALHLEKVTVIGGSAGAPSAMQLCLRHPERCTAMILLVPLAYSGGRAAAPQERLSPFSRFLMNAALHSNFLFWTMSRLAHGATTRTILGTPPQDVAIAPAEEQVRLARILEYIEPIHKRRNGILNDAAVGQSLPRYDLESFNVPTLVLGVENCLYNTYAGARYTAEHIRGARFVGYPSGGHLWVGRETEVWSEISGFLKSLATSAGPI